MHCVVVETVYVKYAVNTILSSSDAVVLEDGCSLGIHHLFEIRK